MSGSWKSLSGMYEVELLSAGPEERLWEISERGISVYRVERVSDLCIRFRIGRKDYPGLRQLCEIKGDTLTLRRELGLHRIFTAVRKRPVVLAGVLTLLLATWILPTRVLFVRVEGNVSVPDNLILEAAEQSGLRFGVIRRTIRSEQVKNSLLGYIPKLQWAGVNTYGCVAVISVREGMEPETKGSPHPVSSIVASRDGVVLECTATKGSLVCKPGDVVRKGQILISGYTDCGLSIQATNAQGEVYAQTLRDVRVVKPINAGVRGEKTEEVRRFSIIVGKKRINLWKNSGIWDATRGRMYQEYILTLPGGFRLPVVWCVEICTRYAAAQPDDSDEDVTGQLQSFAEQYLLQQMNAGRIRTGNYRIVQENGIAILEGSYICTEMIGRIQPEQIGEYDGKTDGKNH